MPRLCPVSSLYLPSGENSCVVFTSHPLHPLTPSPPLPLVRFESELASNNSVRSALKRAASALVKAALERGSKDNITVLCVDLRPASLGETSALP